MSNGSAPFEPRRGGRVPLRHEHGKVSSIFLSRMSSPIKTSTLLPRQCFFVPLLLKFLVPSVAFFALLVVLPFHCCLVLVLA